MPYNEKLEQSCLPQVEDVIKAAKKLTNKA